MPGKNNGVQYFNYGTLKQTRNGLSHYKKNIPELHPN